MIIKTFEVSKKKIDNYNFLLVYGENEGLKNEIIQILKKKLKGNVETYDEPQILNNNESFYEKIFNQSFFEKEKIIIINRCSDKLFDVIENILKKKNYRFKNYIKCECS